MRAIIITGIICATALACVSEFNCAHAAPATKNRLTDMPYEGDRYVFIKYEAGNKKLGIEDTYIVYDKQEGGTREIEVNKANKDKIKEIMKDIFGEQNEDKK